jgi:hypothetical protein
MPRGRIGNWQSTPFPLHGDVPLLEAVPPLQRKRPYVRFYPNRRRAFAIERFARTARGVDKASPKSIAQDHLVRMSNKLVRGDSFMKKHMACPSWLDLSRDRTTFIFVKDKADVVREIFELCIAGLGSYTIAKQFNRRRVPTFGTSSKWDHTNIDNLLRNRATLGEYQPKKYTGSSNKGVPVGEPVLGYYPVVIDEKTFMAAQVARQHHLRAGRGRKGNNLANLFTGITSCHYCGGPVKFHSNNKYKSLICEKVINRSGCVRVGWSYANFESSVLQFLSHPALSGLQNNNLGELPNLIANLKKLRADNAVDLRLALAAELKKMTTELKLASAGENPSPIHSEALIRRDNPNRFFEIRLGNGPSYKGTPV